MKAKIINTGYVSGLLYEHDLKLKETGAQSKNPGTQYITGTIGVATDDAQTNIVPVHFTYIAATTKAGSPNATFTLLKQIYDKTIKTYVDGGNTNVRVNGEMSLNDFYTERNGEVELVSAKRFEGRFVHVVNGQLEADEKQRNVFEMDMLITGTRVVEATDTYPEKNFIKGAIFNSYSKAIMPVEFTVENPNAFAYFEGLGATSSSPVFTKVKVSMVSETIKRQKTEESAFGDPVVTETTSTRKDWICWWAQKETYVWDDPESITAAEVTKAMGDREIYLADIKKRWEDYRASKSAASTGAPTVSTAGAFNF